MAQQIENLINEVYAIRVSKQQAELRRCSPRSILIS